MKDLKPRGLKAPLDLLPLRPLRAISGAMLHGARKYAPWNWTENTNDWRATYTAALLRHAHAYADSTEPDADPESGLSHLAHAGACVMILLFHAGVDFEDPHADQRAVSDG